MLTWTQVLPAACYSCNAKESVPCVSAGARRCTVARQRDATCLCTRFEGQARRSSPNSGLLQRVGCCAIGPEAASRSQIQAQATQLKIHNSTLNNSLALFSSCADISLMKILRHPQHDLKNFYNESSLLS